MFEPLAWVHWLSHLWLTLIFFSDKETEAQREAITHPIIGTEEEQ